MVHCVKIVNEHDDNEYLNKVKRFCENNENLGDRARNELELFDAILDKNIYVVEDSNEAIVAVACCFNFIDRKHTEATEIRCLKKYECLDNLLHSCRLINELIYDAPDENYFSIMTRNQVHSMLKIESYGFMKWNPGDDFFLEIDRDNDGNKINKDMLFYRIDPNEAQDKIQNHAKYLIDIHKSNKIYCEEDGVSIEITLNFPLIEKESHRKVVEDVASGKLFLPFR